MDPEEKRLWVGITVFATLFGVGGYIVFEHALWGWIFMVAGLGGLIPVTVLSRQPQFALGACRVR
jgi:hypothetical protein